MPQLFRKFAETPAENKNQWLEMLRFSKVCYEFGCLSTSYLTRKVTLFCRRTCGQRVFLCQRMHFLVAGRSFSAVCGACSKLMRSYTNSTVEIGVPGSGRDEGEKGQRTCCGEFNFGKILNFPEGLTIRKKFHCHLGFVMRKKKVLSSVTKLAREPMSVRVAPRLKQLLTEGAAARGMALAPWVERVLWASKEVHKSLLQSSSPLDLSTSVPTPLYTADELTLAHLTLLAQATHHLEAIARIMTQAPRERAPLDDMKLAEALHAVKGHLDRLRPLHLPRKAALRTRDVDGMGLS